MPRKAYYEANKEKIAKKAKLYYELNRDKKESYYKENKERIALQQRKYRQNNKENIAATNRAYVLLNKEKTAATKRAYKKRHPERIIEQTKAYYARYPEKVGAKKFVTFVLKPSILKRDGYCCFLCKTKKKRLVCHHIRPVSLCESKNEIVDSNNLITLCVDCHKTAHANDYRKLDEGLAMIFKEYINIIICEETNGKGL